MEDSQQVPPTEAAPETPPDTSAAEAVNKALGVEAPAAKEPPPAEDPYKDFTPEQFREALANETKRRTDAQTALRAKQEGLLAPLKEGATDEEKAAYNAQLNKLRGLPDNADGYGLTSEELKAFPSFTEDHLKELMPGFHERGFTRDQIIYGMEAMQSMLNAESEDVVKTSIANVEEVTKHFGGREAMAPLLADMNAAGVADEVAVLLPPAVMKFAGAMHKELTEARAKLATLTEPDKVLNPQAVTTGSLREQIMDAGRQLLKDPQNAALKARYAELQEQAVKQG